MFRLFTTKNDSYPQFFHLKNLSRLTQSAYITTTKRGIRGLLKDCCNLLLTKRATYW